MTLSILTSITAILYSIHTMYKDRYHMNGIWIRGVRIGCVVLCNFIPMWWCNHAIWMVQVFELGAPHHFLLFFFVREHNGLEMRLRSVDQWLRPLSNHRLYIPLCQTCMARGPEFVSLARASNILYHQHLRLTCCLFADTLDPTIAASILVVSHKRNVPPEN